MKDKDQKELWESYNQLNEGAFGGPGGNPDYDDIGQGQETSDAVSDDDINGRVSEIGSQIRTLDNWIDNVREFGDADNEDVWDETSLHERPTKIDTVILVTDNK